MSATWFITKTERAALSRCLKLLDLNKPRFVLACLFGASGLGAAVALGATAAWLIARASQMPPVLYLEVAVVSVRFFGVSKAVLRYVERLASHHLAVGGMCTLRTNIYQQLAQGSTAKVVSLRRGNLLDRMQTDVDAVGDFLVKSLLPAIVAVIVASGTVIGIACLNWKAAFWLAIALLLSGVVAPLITMRSARLSRLLETESRLQIATLAMGALDGAAEINVSGQKNRLFEQLNQVEDTLYAAKTKVARPLATASAVDLFSMFLAVLTAAWIGSQAVANLELSHVALAVLVLTPLSAFEATAPLGSAALQAITSADAAKRIVELLDDSPHQAGSTISECPSTKRKGSQSPYPAAFSASASRPTSSTVQSSPASVLPTDRHPSPPPTPSSSNKPQVASNLLTDWHVTSDPQTTNTTHPVCLEAQDLAIGWPGGKVVAENLNFQLTNNKHLGIVGPSGIGKTTLLFTLSGMLKPLSGQVRLNGIPISQLSRAEVAQHLVLTPEDAHIFETSVLENLRVANGAINESQARTLLTQAGLSTWLADLPQGLATLVSSSGTISGGERRRLLLARALAGTAPLLLLDEPGEHLDPDTADQLLHDLLRGGDTSSSPSRKTPASQADTYQRGVLLVTHRLTPLDQADEVLLLDHPDSKPNQPAQITERGTHQELLARSEKYRFSLEQERPHVC